MKDNAIGRAIVILRHMLKRTRTAIRHPRGHPASEVASPRKIVVHRFGKVSKTQEGLINPGASVAI